MPDDWPSAEEVKLEMTRDGWYMNVAVVEAALCALRRMLTERRLHAIESGIHEAD